MGINPSLNLDMCPCFKLQVSLSRVSAVVVLERPLDIYGVGVVAFDQVAVIAIHRTYKVGQRCQHPLWETPAKARRPRRELDR